jgi:hypothetical protein
MTGVSRTSTRYEQGQFAKARADAELHEDIQRGRARYTVASHSIDAEDCRHLLSMLGLDGRKATD